MNILEITGASSHAAEEMWPSPEVSGSRGTISTALLTSMKSSSSSLVVFSFSLTAVTPSNPTMCLAGGLSCPPIAVSAWTVSAMSDVLTASGSGAYNEITESELRRSPIEGS